MANIEDAIFRAVVDYTPKVCVERALQNGDGLYHNDKFVDLEEQCLVFEDMLRELFKIAKQLNPREVQGALRRFNAVHLGRRARRRRPKRAQCARAGSGHHQPDRLCEQASPQLGGRIQGQSWDWPSGSSFC